ncbi:hypothetical protein [Novosphingobium sp.]|jgi:hypothetical protein|uniref:hypothetical protein n=1 Tax=Novosphingobium sp. TaxID=1874826 RepID=UPI002FE20973
MPSATFETLEGDEIDVDPAEVVSIAEGGDDDTTLIELDDGQEITVVASPVEVVAELGLDPLEFLNLDDDEAVEDDDEDYESE